MEGEEKVKEEGEEKVEEEGEEEVEEAGEEKGVKEGEEKSEKGGYEVDPKKICWFCHLNAKLWKCQGCMKVEKKPRYTIFNQICHLNYMFRRATAVRGAEQLIGCGMGNIAWLYRKIIFLSSSARSSLRCSAPLEAHF